TLEIAIENGNSVSVDLVALKNGTVYDDQTLNLTNNSLTIENGNSIDLSEFKDNTDNQDLEGASLNGTVLQVDIENGASATVDLAPLVAEQLALILELAQKVNELEEKLNNLSNGVITSSDNESLKSTQATLYQNSPNPSHDETLIKYFLPNTVRTATIQISNSNGIKLKEYALQETGEGEIILDFSIYPSGTYLYSLIADRQIVDTKRMVIY
ncbi:T9SS type A sorting domain-containing protein, partial [Xanthovirga aplysinae]|uniref:T9SS type A sorting domain-containing protein n=1 Tax=Xanthovirga aplysinae TaxID=2529853 RepID=UPI0012BB75C9